MARNLSCTLCSRIHQTNEQLMGRDRRFPSSGTGFTMVEIIASVAILLLLASVALPVLQVKAKRARETELRQDLRELRTAIDRYKDFADHGLIATQADTYGYPPDLRTLCDGVPIRTNTAVKFKFLRRIPVDPMTGSTDWGLRSVQDDPDSRGWGGRNVFDVYSKSDRTALDGTSYADW
jgi:general secretion pathway protein G